METNAQTNLREAIMDLEASGILSEKVLKEAVDEADGKNKITGYLTLKTSDTNFARFNVNVSEFYKSGEPNSLFDGMRTVMEEYLSIAEVGEASATRVKTQRATIAPYTNKFGKETCLYRCNIFRSINPEDADYNIGKSEFAIEMYISAIVPEVATVDGETEETGRMVVKGWCPTYNGIEPFSLIAEGELAQDIDEYSPGDTAYFHGRAVNRNVRIPYEIPAKIGKSKIEYKTDFKNEFIIEGITEPFSEDGYVLRDKTLMPYSPETIRKAINVRQEKIEEAKSRPATPKNSATRPSAASKGRTLNF